MVLTSMSTKPDLYISPLNISRIIKFTNSINQSILPFSRLSLHTSPFLSLAWQHSAVSESVKKKKKMMQWHCLSLPSISPLYFAPLSVSTKPTFSISNPSLPSISPLHSTFTKPVTLFNSLRLSLSNQKLMGRQRQRQRRSGAVCFSSSALLSPRNLQWVSAVSAGILMLVRGTSINKAYLVPLFALQAPASIVSWMQGEYGAWTAFLALLVRLFFSLPGELELPFMTLLLVIVAPLQAMDLRGTQGGIIISLAIAAYLAFQHFARVGNLQKAFHQDSIVATLAIICCTIAPCPLLI